MSSPSTRPSAAASPLSKNEKARDAEKQKLSDTRKRKLITDKTGTLTHGSFSIQTIKPYKVKEENLMEMIYAAESLSTHPIGKAICHGQNLKKLAAEQKDFVEIPGLGVETKWKKNKILAGSDKLLKKFGIETPEVSEIGTAIHCAVNNEYYGYTWNGLSLKYFKEDAPEYYVVCAGSLLAVALNDKGFPVGKIDFLNMLIFPYTFLLPSFGN